MLEQCPRVPVALRLPLQLKAISWVRMSRRNSQWVPPSLCAVAVQQSSIYWSLTGTVVGHQPVLKGALLCLSRAARLCCSTGAGGAEDTWESETRKGSASEENFCERRNFRMIKCRKIEPHYPLQSTHGRGEVQENWNLHKIKYLHWKVKSEMIMNYCWALSELHPAPDVSNTNTHTKNYRSTDVFWEVLK